MKSPIMKLAVAAVIAVAAISGIVMWTHTGSGIVLANVLAQVQQATAYMYQMTMTISGKAPNGPDMNQNMDATILIAQDYGMKMTMSVPDPNGGTTPASETYMLPQEKTMISLMPVTKQYMRMELDDTLIERSRQQNYDPGSMLKQILACKYESLGRSVIDGVEVEGFQTTDPNYLAGMAGQANVKIWVDVKTQFPVRSEMDMQIGEMQVHGVVHDFQWDYPVTAADFTPTIPADYTEMPAMKMPAMNEESAIAGLKVCADLAGRYPEKLDFMAASSLMSEFQAKRLKDNPALKQMAEEIKGLSREEAAKKMKEQMAQQTKEMMDKLMPIQGAVMFYATLVQEKKDPAYYGKVVTPQDADKVLMRWKIADNQYRVIFGSLHAETVDAPTLAELEKDLPK